MIERSVEKGVSADLLCLAYNKVLNHSDFQRGKVQPSLDPLVNLNVKQAIKSVQISVLFSKSNIKLTIFLHECPSFDQQITQPYLIFNIYTII